MDNIKPETNREKFIRIAEARTQKIIDTIADLSKKDIVVNDVVKKYDPPAEDLTYASINVIDPSKIFNIIQY